MILDSKKLEILEVVLFLHSPYILNLINKINNNRYGSLGHNWTH